MNLNSPGPAPGFPHRRRTSPPGEITLTRWLRSVTYRLPSGPIARASGWSSPSDFALCRAMIVKGFGRAGEAAAALGCPPTGAAAFAAQPAPRTARPPTRAAAARQNGPPLIPSLATVVSGFTFPLILHLVLAYPGGRAGSAPARALIAAAYAEALLAAAVLALFRDPYL